MVLVASSLSAKSLSDAFYRGICKPRVQLSYNDSTKTKSHLSHSGAPNIPAAHKDSEIGTFTFVFGVSDPLILT